jgi:predicted PP-loop superfamily ATPase
MTLANDTQANDTHNTLRAVKLYAAEGDLSEAEILLRQCLTHVEEKYGKQSLDAAYVGSELANLLESQGKLEESGRCLEIVRKILLDEVRNAKPDWKVE